MMTRSAVSVQTLLFASLLGSGLFGTSPALAQNGPAGPIVIQNRSGSPIIVSKLRYTTAGGAVQKVDGSWTLAAGFNGYLTAGGRKIVATKIEYDLATTDGQTVNWSAACGRLDADGDFTSVFTPDNLAAHQRLLGKVVARKPEPTGPTEEQLKRGVVKALGAAALHVAASRDADDFGQALAIGLARKGRDELIGSAVADLFPDLTADEARLVRVLTVASLDGSLTPNGLRAADARARVQDYLRDKHPEMALTSEVAQFLVGINNQMKK